MSGIRIARGGKVKVTPSGLLLSALALAATGFFFAAGYDLYARLFKKAA